MNEFLMRPNFLLVGLTGAIFLVLPIFLQQNKDIPALSHKPGHQGHLLIMTVYFSLSYRTSLDPAARMPSHPWSVVSTSRRRTTTSGQDVRLWQLRFCPSCPEESSRTAPSRTPWRVRKVKSSLRVFSFSMFVNATLCAFEFSVPWSFDLQKSWPNVIRRSAENLGIRFS